MRQAIIDALRGLSLGTFKVSSDLPWTASGTPLYQKNPKVFYVDEPDTVQTTAISFICSSNGIYTEETTISVFVLVDAKQKPANYDSLMTAVRGIKNTPAITAVRSREVDVTTTFEADTLLTEFEFRFTAVRFN